MIWVDLCSEGEVVFAGVRDADGCVHVLQIPLAELVEVDTANVVINEMGVLGDDRLDTHELGSHKQLRHEHTRAQVTMAQVDMLPDQDLS